ncbi:carotenoid biosynthesis protein [Catenuloplanes indicus]|uniref:Membrane protein n=1 Tax=Catenuloplanes indicus TaxID=137267 RepID=A0AAE4AWF5_9ACTN|nr:carotenoid biosynthesis protein [Catenuloplanes indicus]MDQ0364952.1 putative membrane protein [Catenuloplanes indicus]
MRTDRRTTILWWVIAAQLVLAVGTTLAGWPQPILNVVLLVAVVAMHALRRYTLASFAVFALITFVVSNVYENLSIVTGFPFGDYYYSDNLGLKLFLVPLVIAPAYFATGYFSWQIAHILLGIRDARPRGRDVVLVPLIASFVMVMWDLVMDPNAATAGGAWIWENGGGYFGVPLSNFAGWFLCVYTIFQLFALYLARRGPAAVRPEAETVGDAFWYQAIVPYVSVALVLTARFFTREDGVVTDPAGQSWQLADLGETTVLVSVFTMYFVALLSTLLVGRSRPSV